MKTYQFIEEHDLLLNEYFYFTRLDGMTITGSMSSDKEKAYDIFCHLMSGNAKSIETVIFEVKTP